MPKNEKPEPKRVGIWSTRPTQVTRFAVRREAPVQRPSDDKRDVFTSPNSKVGIPRYAS